MTISKKWLAGLAFAALAPMANASTNLIINGGFEDSIYSGPFTTFSAGSSGLTGWTIVDGSVDLVNTYWVPSQGHYSLDLSGQQDGTIAQTFGTTVGQRYTVSFDMAGNPDDLEEDPIKYLQVGLSQLPIYEFDTSERSLTNMGWRTKSFTFTAVSSSTTLHFTGLQESAYGVALDNISVTAVPEPESFAMLLAGLGVLGAVVRRKRNSDGK